ncbi:MAG: alpha/beta hydrolase family protein [Bulleidia sp.]
MNKLNRAIEISDLAAYRLPMHLCENPSATVVAFEVQRADNEKNAYHRDIWVLENGALRQLTATSDAGILAWQDERHLLISRHMPEDKRGQTYVYRISLDGGEAVLWKTLPFICTALEKTSAGYYVACGQIDASAPDLYMASEKEREDYFKEVDKNKDYAVLDEVPYWANGMRFTNKKRTAVFLVSDTCRRLSEPLFDVASIATDKDTLYVHGAKMKSRLSLYGQIDAYDLKTGKRHVVYGRRTHAMTKLFVLRHQLYVLATDMKAYGINETASIYKVEEKELKRVYQPQVSLYNSVLSDTIESFGKQLVYNDHLYSLATVENRTVLYRFDEKFKPHVLWDRDGMIADFVITKEQIVLLYQDWKGPGNLYVYAQKKLRQISDFSKEAMAGRFVSKPLPITYTSGVDKLTGWVLMPRNFQPHKKYPAVLNVHGGPRCAYGATFFHEMQVWASRGYFVFFTNIRGSDGRGDAFADIRGQYGAIDYQNLMDFTDAVLRKYPMIDAGRICVTGGSYGGFMTNWIITHTNRYCCAASQRSISNWISMSFIADIGPYFGFDQCGIKSPFDFETQWRFSPLRYAQSAKTPTLFIHSDEDYRCPLDQGMQMMQALTVQGVETRMVVFHGENHELSRSGKPQHRIRRLEEMTGWFDDHACRGIKK